MSICKNKHVYSIMPPTKQDLANFTKWLTENNISFPYISIGPSQNGGLGLFNTAAFQGITDSLATIPTSVCLNATNIYNYASANHPFFHLILETILTSHHEYLKTERITICLFLIFEKFFKRHNCSYPTEETNLCFWCPYINILPSLEDLTIPLTYPPDLLVLLSGTRLYTSTLAKKSKLEHEFTIIQSFCKSIGELTFEMWLWADAMIWSRTLSFRSRRSFMATEGLDIPDEDENDLHLIPLLDFANHSFTPLARWHINSLVSSVLLLPLDDEVLTYTIPAEITITYGSKPNQELLFIHGFTIPSNPNPVSFTIPAAPFFGEDLNAEKKLSWMQMMKLKPTLTLQRNDNEVQAEARKERDQSYDGWAFESMSVMWLCCLGDEDGLEINIKDENIVIAVKGEMVTSVAELDRIIRTLPLFQVFHLRATVLLLSALDYHYSELLSVDTENSFETRKRLALDKGIDPNIIGYIEIYRNEELEVIAWGLERLLRRKEMLLESEVVISYLENASGDGDDV